MLEKILQAFDLARRPFGAMPDPKCFFTTDAIRETLSELTMSLQSGQGISILTGDAGSGKSLLCERLKADLSNRFEVVLLRHAKFESSRAVLQEILSELGTEFDGLNETELRLALRRRVQAVRPDQEALLLMIDEADNFPTEALEELRILADLADDGTPLVRLMLCGQWRLEERLAEREFNALNQRVSAHLSLQSLSTQEAADYIRFRLAWAGGVSDSIFTERASQFVVRAAAGLPRCLNLLADHCLYLGFGQQERPIGAETVRRALTDLKRLPLQWNDLHDLAAFSNSGDETLVAASVDAAESSQSTFETESSPTATHAILQQASDATHTMTFTSDAPSVCFEFGADETSDLTMNDASAASDDFNDARPDAATTVARSDSLPEELREPSETTVFEFGADLDDVMPRANEATLMASPESTTCDNQEQRLQSQPTEVAIESLVACNGAASALSEMSDGCCMTITAPRRSRGVDCAAVVAPDTKPIDDATDSITKPAVCHDAVQEFDHENDHYSDHDGSSLSDVSLTHEEQPVPQFVEEIVLDHYAALQEPEFSGIIWNLARHVSEESPTDAATSVVANTSESIEALIDEPPRMTLEFNAALRRRDSAASTSGSQHVQKFEVDDADTTEPYDASTDGGLVDDIRSPHPNRYLDAIMPLLSDVIDPENDVVLPETTSRSREEIEADLIDALTSGEPDEEDQIGSEVLDLCIDAQAAIRQAQDAVAQSLRGQLEAIDPDDNDDDDDTFDPRFEQDFDVVQPEDIPVMAAVSKPERRPEGKREQHQRDERMEDPQEQSRRPFSRLFSELRRRQRLVG